jgi:hypothetical protein
MMMYKYYSFEKKKLLLVAAIVLNPVVFVSGVLLRAEDVDNASSNKYCNKKN